jgi:hypothetical protein
MIRTSVLTVALALFTGSFAFAQTTFGGTVQGAFVNPSNGSVEGLGTNRVVFLGSPDGALSFTGNTGVSATPTPFLLGLVEYSPGGETPDSMNFRLGFDTSNPDGSSSISYFCPVITTEKTGEPGQRTSSLVFGGSKWTSQIGNDNYTLRLEGVTTTTTWDPAEALETVQGVIGETTGLGYVWASLTLAPEGTQAQGDGSIGCGFNEDDDCGCHCNEPPPGVPEPATWVMLATAFCGFGLWSRSRRIATSAAASGNAV